MEETLGYHNSNDAVLVGVGSLGRALLGYGGFAECGLNIVAAFDANPALAGKTVSGKRVFPMEKLPGYVQQDGGAYRHHHRAGRGGPKGYATPW